MSRSGRSVVELADGLAFVESFANVTAITDSDELALIDTGSVIYAQQVHDVGAQLDRRRRCDTAVYTHGHIDHCFGVPAFEAEPGAPAGRRWSPTRRSPPDSTATG